jgi:putative photosynthetic complex assembly protein 2
MLANAWIAALVALFVWWFSTGAILAAVKWSDRHSPGARLACALGGLPVLGLGIWGYTVTLTDTSVAGVYWGFLSALAIWGWIELAFLTGQITGPNRYPCPSDTPGWERFLRAWGTIAHHEVLLVTAMVLLAVAGWGADNIAGLWTFVVLFFARISAKLNLFFGVPRINVDFLPTALAHLPSHFRIARMNWVFPISVSALTFAAGCWLERLATATTPAETVTFALLAALTGLAALEHWLMVLPLPDEKLWRWMLPAPETNKKELRPEDAHGL